MPELFRSRISRFDLPWATREYSSFVAESLRKSEPRSASVPAAMISTRVARRSSRLSIEAMRAVDCKSNSLRRNRNRSSSRSSSGAALIADTFGDRGRRAFRRSDFREAFICRDPLPLFINRSCFAKCFHPLPVLACRAGDERRQVLVIVTHYSITPLLHYFASPPILSASQRPSRAIVELHR